MLQFLRSLLAIMVFISLPQYVCACGKHQAQANEGTETLVSTDKAMDLSADKATDLNVQPAKSQAKKTNSEAVRSETAKSNDDQTTKSDDKQASEKPVKDQRAKLQNNKDQTAKSQDNKEQTAKSQNENQNSLSANDVAVESAPAQAQNNAQDLEVVEFVLTNQINAREPKDIKENFAKEDERAFAFARLNVKADKEVTFVWIRNGQEHARQTLPVHMAKKWRTYSSVKLKSGEWKVQLLSENNVIAEKTFTLE